MVNEVILVGNLGRDPEMTVTEGGRNRTTFSMATNRRWKDAAGELIEEVTWHRVTAWGPLAEVAHSNLEKGRQIFVRGRIRHYETTDPETNNKVQRTEIVAQDIRFLGKKNGNGENAGQPASEAEGEIPF